MHYSQYARLSTLIMIVASLYACTPTQPRPESQAVRDYIAVAELEEVDRIRTTMAGQADYKLINDEFIVFETRDDNFLIEFRRRCHELLDDTRIPPDIRRDSNIIRSRFDTIRGCRIDRIYAIDEAQAEELVQLGKEADDG